MVGIKKLDDTYLLGKENEESKAHCVGSCWHQFLAWRHGRRAHRSKKYTGDGVYLQNIGTYVILAKFPARIAFHVEPVGLKIEDGSIARLLLVTTATQQQTTLA
jgi:hypothetical protein